MDSLLKNNGLSARRRTIDKIRKAFLGLSHLVNRFTKRGFIIATGIILLSCQDTANGQDARDPEKNKLSARQDSLKPKVNIEVKRHYDDDSNLIGFDSVYSSYYSNIQGDTINMNSVMHHFDSFFGREHPSFFDDAFGTFFFRDSLLFRDFFSEDFFLKRYESNDDYLSGMMQRIDSIKNRFYQAYSREWENTKSP